MSISTHRISGIGLLILFACLLTAVCTESGYAFNGDRKGFVGSFALGWTPVAGLHDFSSSGNYPGGSSLGLGLGYGLDSSNILMIEASGVFKRRVGYMILRGITWYRYLSTNPRSICIVLGVGSYQYDENCWVTAWGVGAKAGFGWEVFKQVQVEMVGLMGTYSDGSNREYRGALSFQVNVLAY